MHLLSTLITRFTAPLIIWSLAPSAAGAQGPARPRPTSIAHATRDVDRDGFPDSLGRVIRVTGVVTTYPRHARDAFWYVVIQDSTAGLRVLADSAFTPLRVLQRGSQIEVWGTLTRRRGAEELLATGLREMGTAPLPKPRDFLVAQLRALNPVSQLVRVEGELTSHVRGSERSFEFRDRTGTLPVRIPSRFLIDADTSSQLIRGGTVQMVAILGRSNTLGIGGGLRLAPRTPSDIVFEVPPDYTHLIAFGIIGVLLVLGAYLWTDRHRARRRAVQLEALSQELTQSDRALRENELKYRTIMEQSTDGIFLFNDKGIIVSVNATVASMLGRPKQELEGHSMAVTLADSELNRQPVRFDLLEAGEELRRERVMRRADGSTFVAEIASKKMWDGHYMGIARDISSRRQAEQALRRSEELFRALTENSAEITTVLDAEGRTTYISPSYERVMGYTLEQPLGTDTFAVIHPDDLPRVRSLFATLLQVPGATTETTVRARHADGEYRLLEIFARNLLHDPAVNGIVCHLRDVTAAHDAREKLEESEAALRQAQRMEGIGQLAGGVAHDFNNILTAIQLHAESLLLETPPDDWRREEIVEIQRAGERAAGLTRQLLAFSRRQILRPRSLAVNDVVAGVHRMLDRLVGEDFQLVFHPGENLPEVVADPGQLEQVIVNLVVNSRDAMKQGGRITIATRCVTLDDAFLRTHPGSSRGEHVAMSVADEGTGMSPEVLARVFEPFFTTKPIGKGTGLGMATVYGIVKQSGGYTEVQSEPGRGTTVTVYIPQRSDDAMLAEGGMSPAVMDVHGSGLKATVLLVEDEDAVRTIARRILERAGFSVMEACNGVEALVIARANCDIIDVVVSDVVMPEMGGVHLRAALRSVCPAAPVVLTSGYTDDDVIRRGLDTEGTLFLPKPFTSDSLVSAVREALKGEVATAGSA